MVRMERSEPPREGAGAEVIASFSKMPEAGGAVNGKYAAGAPCGRWGRMVLYGVSGPGFATHTRTLNPSGRRFRSRRNPLLNDQQ